MVESTLVVLLKKFDKQHLKDFNNFVRSPFFNTNKAVINLYEYLRKQYPEYSPEKLQKEYVYKKIFGKTSYNDGFLRVLMSNLQSLAEEYLTYIGLSHDPLIKKKYLIDQLSFLGEQKLAAKVLNKELKLLEKFKPADPDDYLGMHYMAFYKKYFYSTQFVVSKGNKPDESLYDEQKYLIYHFLLKALSNHFYHLNQKQVINYEPQLAFLDEIIIFLNRNPEYLETPILNITYLRVLLLKDNDIKDYYKLKHTFYDIHSKIERKDCFNTISIIINYCQKNYMLTENELFLKEKLEILKFAVEHEMNSFEKGDGFDSGRFANIISTSLDLGEISWAEGFLKDYSRKLESDRKEFVTGFARAMISFNKGELDDTMKHMAHLRNPAAATDKFNMKVLQLRLFYEKGFFEQAESAADSFRHLIQNDKLLPESYKEAHKNFYSLYVKLLAARAKDVKEGISEMTETIKSVNPLIHKKWFMKKAEEQVNI